MQIYRSTIGDFVSIGVTFFYDIIYSLPFLNFNILCRVQGIDAYVLTWCMGRELDPHKIMSDSFSGFG